MCRSAEFLDEGSEGREAGAEAEPESRAVASQLSGQCPLYLYFRSRWQCPLPTVSLLKFGGSVTVISNVFDRRA